MQVGHNATGPPSTSSSPPWWKELVPPDAMGVWCSSKVKKQKTLQKEGNVIYIYIYISRPRKRRIFPGGGNFQAKLKQPTQQAVLASVCFTYALVFVTSASSFWCRVFYREFAACLSVVFSGEAERKTSFQGPGIYTILCMRESFFPGKVKGSQDTEGELNSTFYMGSP